MILRKEALIPIHSDRNAVVEETEDEKSFSASDTPTSSVDSQKCRARVNSQLPEEEPLFNLTLIEFLQSDYEIDLSEFRDELPQ